MREEDGNEVLWVGGWVWGGWLHAMQAPNSTTHSGLTHSLAAAAASSGEGVGYPSRPGCGGWVGGWVCVRGGLASSSSWPLSLFLRVREEEEEEIGGGEGRGRSLSHCLLRVAVRVVCGLGGWVGGGMGFGWLGGWVGQELLRVAGRGDEWMNEEKRRRSPAPAHAGWRGGGEG